MKLGPFISGIFGTLGFGLSVLAGISSGNTLESILLRGLLSAAICYVVGYIVGVMAQQVAQEHAQHIAKGVARQDDDAENKRREEQAELEAQSAVPAEASATPAAPITANT